jgi:hypothetical protein
MENFEWKKKDKPIKKMIKVEMKTVKIALKRRFGVKTLFRY